MASRKHVASQRNDALTVLTTLHGDDARWENEVAVATISAEIAEEIFALRERHQLTQQALATLIGSSQPAIARMENGEYLGHSIAVLRRMAAAVGERASFRFLVPQPPEALNADGASRTEAQKEARCAHPHLTE